MLCRELTSWVCGEAPSRHLLAPGCGKAPSRHQMLDPGCLASQGPAACSGCHRYTLVLQARYCSPCCSSLWLVSCMHLQSYSIQLCLPCCTSKDCTSNMCAAKRDRKQVQENVLPSTAGWHITSPTAYTFASDAAPQKTASPTCVRPKGQKAGAGNRAAIDSRLAYHT